MTKEISNRSYTIEKISSELGTSKKDADALLRNFVDILKTQLQETGEVLLPGFGRLQMHTRPSRVCSNPRTGEQITVPEKSVVKFKQFKKYTQAQREAADSAE